MVNDSSAANLDQTLTALADPTRRAILQRLMLGEARVTDLAAPFAISLNAVSKHIRMLERGQLVRRRRQWREHWVSYNPKPLEEAAAWLDQQRAFWHSRLESLEVALRAEAATTNTPINRSTEDHNP